MKKHCKCKGRGQGAMMPVPVFPEVLPAGSPLPGLKYGEAFVPPQFYGRTWGPEEALHKGTIFPELFSPYFG